MTNPYAYTPIADISTERPDISRSALARLIRQWLNEKVEPKEFEDQLEEFEFSPERAVQMVATDINWSVIEDDLEAATLDRKSWNLIQRYLLLLDSGFEVRTQSKVFFSGRQPRALIAMVLSGVAISLMPFDVAELWTLIPFWLSSHWLQWRWPMQNRLTQPLDHVLLPFNSLYDLHEARKAAPQFTKQSWPHRGSDTQHTTNPLTEFTEWLLHQSLWFLFSPIVLAVQAMPHSDTREFACAPE